MPRSTYPNDAILGLPNIGWLFKVTGTNPATWRSDRRRKTTVGAFGASQPMSTRPLLMDAVAVHLRDDLAERIEQKLAVAIVRGFFDVWAEGISRAEHEDADINFIVVELEPRKFGVEDNWRCFAGPANKLDAYAASLPKPIRLFLFVPLLEVLANIRRCASELGFDLSRGRFFVPPGHRLLADIRTQWVKWRTDNVVAGRVGSSPKILRRELPEIQVLDLAA